jgi:hypothetical protein
MLLIDARVVLLGATCLAVVFLLWVLWNWHLELRRGRKG